MKLPTFATTCAEVFNVCISLELISVAVGNLIINTVILSTCYKYANDAFVAKNVNNGFVFIYIWLFMTIANELYQRYIAQPIMHHFDTEVDIASEKTINNVLLALDYEANRDINGDKKIENKMFRARFKISTMVSSGMSTIMSFGHLLGHVFWICMISSASLIGYTIAIVLLCFVNQTSSPCTDEKMALYDNYWFYKTNFINENIHGNGSVTMDNINKANRDVEVMRHKSMSETNALKTYVIISFSTVMAINCFYLGSAMSIAELITYIQYCTSLQHAIISSFNLYKSYVESIRDYGEYIELMSKYRTKVEVSQIVPSTTIVIEYLSYTYPDSKAFSLVIDKTMSINCGDIVLINGDSGNGKSTFFDILGGYKHDDSYTCIANVNGVCVDGFECLRDSRVYTEQKDYISQDMSVAELVTNKIYDETIDMNLVFKALEMCACNDFVTADNVYDKKPKFSGGQEGRIKIARTMYRILVTQPRIILLDEIDKAVQPASMVKIMNNIFAYCKLQKIFTFVIAHSSEMQRSEQYDKVFTFEKGEVV